VAQTNQLVHVRHKRGVVGLDCVSQGGRDPRCLNQESPVDVDPPRPVLAVPSRDIGLVQHFLLVFAISSTCEKGKGETSQSKHQTGEQAEFFGRKHALSVTDLRRNQGIRGLLDYVATDPAPAVADYSDGPLAALNHVPARPLVNDTMPPARIERVKVTKLSGFPEFLPAERIVEQHFLDVIRETFELHGFTSLETRAVEPVGRLVGKGGDADKEIYALSRMVRDDDSTDTTTEMAFELGLHFDLTVPFARFVLENAGKLTFPYRRYQIQKVWRGERPQEGRYREFTQADIDVVDMGELSPHFEAEMPLVVAEIFSKLPIGRMTIQVNNRKIPEGFYQGIGIQNIAGTLRIVDKLDKIGPDKVKALLVEAGLTDEQAAQCLALAAIRTEDLSFVEQVRALGVENPILDEGLEALSAVIQSGLDNAPGAMVADLKIARGLDYYTGTVYETQLEGYESWGSFCSGGRYDALASDGRTTYPGVGISIGLSRLLGLLIGKGLVTASRATPAAVLVAVVEEESRRESSAVAQALRARGIACEVAPSAAKFGKQIRYADRRGIPFVWFPGGGDVAHQVKDIRSGDQVDADPATWTPPVDDLRPTITATPTD
jgi:histidyl-tRNA synthetase